VADPQFENPRLAEIYDHFDPDRPDLDVYAALVEELGARSSWTSDAAPALCLHVGRTGVHVIGVDPAAASLNVARRKPAADQVRWLQADPTVLPPLQVDLVTMTGNVVQVFLTDDEWTATLRSVRLVLRPGGWLVFESRDPSPSLVGMDPTGVVLANGYSINRTVEAYVDVLDVSGEFVTFRSTYVFDRDEQVLTSDSTLALGAG